MRHSRSSSKNKGVLDWTDRYKKKGNMQFFADALAALKKQKLGNEGQMVIGLVGSRDFPGYTLRTAQSVLRWDLRPSLWSHAFLISGKATNAGSLKRLPILQVTLHTRNGEFPRPERNGVHTDALACYDNPKVDANVALLAVRMEEKEAAHLIKRAKDGNLDRVRYNLWETLGMWQGYLWAQGARPNPLREGVPVASSSFVEYVYEGIHLDLTPGASSRNSAPEHLWNAALWWHDAYKSQNRQIAGMCVLRDKGCSMMGTDE